MRNHDCITRTKMGKNLCNFDGPPQFLKRWGLIDSVVSVVIFRYSDIQKAVGLLPSQTTPTPLSLFPEKP
ncbi:hypothetical protein L6452_26664 [Arctium lappa]|uniref:Uncharacterized protein n=1 Tax=Arctium lappa TaxID=4217 RepID=A0ACB8ZU57_ARCLA|nr:hypothetical protein L6452_26664 [Arctium lappa]